jgi:hypothetical protein
MEPITIDQKIELLKLAELRAARLKETERYSTVSSPKPMDTLGIYDEYLKRLTASDAATSASDQGAMEQSPNSIQAELEQLREGFQSLLVFLQSEIGARKEAFGLRKRERGTSDFLRGIRLPDSPSPCPGSPPPTTAQGGATEE